MTRIDQPRPDPVAATEGLPTGWTWPITHHHINTMRVVLDQARAGELDPAWRDTIDSGDTTLDFLTTIDWVRWYRERLRR